jgi:6-phosphogluconolactonase
LFGLNQTSSTTRTANSRNNTQAASLTLNVITLRVKSINLSIFADAEELARAAASTFVNDAGQAINDHGRFAVALSGGNTPRRVYELLGTEVAAAVDWQRTFIFFGDERAVAPEHPESNYRMVREALLSRISIPAANVFRVSGELGAESGASAYEQSLRTFFARSPTPTFDLIFLGVGRDGHTASLFPGSESLRETTRWVRTTRSPEDFPDRVTLTLPAINAAAHAVFLVSGTDKKEILAEIINEVADGKPDKPAALVAPGNGVVDWFVDQAAAQKLDQQ